MDTSPDDADPPLSAEQASDLIDEGNTDRLAEYLSSVERASTADRKESVQALRSLADERPSALGGLLSALVPFLTDDDRSIRLTTAKLFVTVAETDSAALLPCVPAITDRLADDEEFYYVRARCAEVLGYAALADPDAVATPEVLADLRIGLAFDEPEVAEKLAKALEYVALADPDRLRHQVPDLADHLDDDRALVRYHLCTALAVVGTGHPEQVVAARGALTERLDDENPYVRGRAHETLGFIARADTVTEPARGRVEAALDADEPFVAERAAFVMAAIEGEPDECEGPSSPGTLEGIRATTEEAVAEIRTPDHDGECAHCGLALPENGPPLCPRCGAPH